MTNVDDRWSVPLDCLGLKVESANKGMRYLPFSRAGKTKRVREAVALMWRTLRPEVRAALQATARTAGILVTLTRRSPGELDDDNLAGALKAVRDEVATSLGLDDRDPRIKFKYDQIKTKPGRYSVLIVFEPTEE